MTRLLCASNYNILFVDYMPHTEFVSKTDCTKTMEPLRSDLTTVLKALVGDDLRGGLVKDVAELKTLVKTNSTSKARWGRKEWSLVAVAAISALASVVVALIQLFC